MTGRPHRAQRNLKVSAEHGGCFALKAFGSTTETVTIAQPPIPPVRRLQELPIDGILRQQGPKAPGKGRCKLIAGLEKVYVFQSRDSHQKNNMAMGWPDGSMGKGTCHQAWWLEGTSSRSGPQTSTCVLWHNPNSITNVILKIRRAQ